MHRLSVSPLPTPDVSGTLRLFYFMWNIVLILILFVIGFRPESHFSDIEKIALFVVGGPLCTWLSFLLGVRLKVMPTGGMVDSGNLTIKSRLNIRVFISALVAQAVPFWYQAFMYNNYLTFLLVIILGGLAWLSANAIKIEIIEQLEVDTEIENN